MDGFLKDMMAKQGSDMIQEKVSEAMGVKKEDKGGLDVAGILSSVVDGGKSDKGGLDVAGLLGSVVGGGESDKGGLDVAGLLSSVPANFGGGDDKDGGALGDVAGFARGIFK